MTTMFDGGRVPELKREWRLMIARLNAGMNQGELADAIGMSRQTVSSYENGTVKPRRVGLNAWALVTGVPVQWLIDGTVPDGDGPDGGQDVDGGEGQEDRRSSDYKSVITAFPVRSFAPSVVPTEERAA